MLVEVIGEKLVGGLWKGIEFPSDKEDWKKFEQNNREIVLNMLFYPIIKKK